MALRTAQLPPQLAGGVYYQLAVLFQIFLARSIFDVRGVTVSAAKADSSSIELVRKATSSSVSLVEIPTTLLEDALALLLNFLFVTVVHCWLSTMSGWTHIVSFEE